MHRLIPHSLTNLLSRSTPTPVRDSVSLKEQQIIASLDANERFTLRVGIAAQFWDAPMTGSGQYLHELWRALPHVGPEHDYSLIGDAAEAGAALPLPSGLLPPWLRRRPAFVRALERRGEGFLLGNADLRKIWWEQAGLVNAARMAADMNRPLDVLHYPYWAAPYFYPALYGQTPGRWRDSVGGRVARPALVVTVHDLIPIIMPEYAPALKHRLYFQMVAAATRKADLVLADSEHSRQDVLRLLKLPPDRVVAVPLAVNAQFRPVTDPATLAEFRARYTLGDGPLVGYLGGFDVRKNVPRLIRAFAAALPCLNAEGKAWTLVIAGKLTGTDPRIFPDLRAVCREVGLAYADEGDATSGDCPVRFIGMIPEVDKSTFYSLADIYAFPSLYEGFGLTPLEALACGAVVLTSNTTSIPEVVGDAAVTVAPEDTAGLTRALCELGADAALRMALRERGPAQAAKFTWERTARRTLEMYQMAECLVTRGTG